ncbi:hypothetical protein J3459_008371 [Metarhizium acridum]|nr:hypothetical protein J3459_008371 [Metarhizium acridum]
MAAPILRRGAAQPCLVCERTYNDRSLTLKIEKVKTFYGPSWRLFFEALKKICDRYRQLGSLSRVDLGLSRLVLTCVENKRVKSTDLCDKTLFIGMYHSLKVINYVRKVLGSKAIHAAHPGLWACNSPSTAFQRGSQNLMYAVNKTLLAGKNAPQFEEPKRLNDCLGLRAYDALVAYLCGVGSVHLKLRD